ncbi:hypothetical protein [Lactiplantibacillus plantarum]|uniref:hypothetical protein n=1 Tax=Lactiplantibacillus plantarum TaxID=1590 RepID=UPI002238093F|nr:hypothetical protein [Lactiplantibacillus plantarum]MCW6116615.1 hypothetical protein [Lactiplantibacillus plantarum]
MAESNATQVILTDDGIKIIKAQNTADNAASGVTNLNDPNLMSVIEKQNNIGQFAGLTSQYNVLVQNAKDDGIDTTAVTTAYNNLNKFMADVLADPDHASDIDRATYKKYQDAYNEELAKLQNALQNNANNKFTSAASATSQAASTANAAKSAADSTYAYANSEISVQSTATAKAQSAADNAFSKAQEVGSQADSEISVQSTATAKAQSAADNAFSKAQEVGSQADSEIALQSNATAKAQSAADSAFSQAVTAIDTGKATSQAVTALKDGSTLTIAQLGNGLASKVSNSEYASYKEQTASQIGQMVTNGAFSAYQQTTADLISTKVATKDFTAYQATTAKAINSKVESKDFNTYKTQTADMINDKVSNSEYASNKEQTASQIADRVSNSAFSTYQEQTASQFASKVDNGDFNTYKTQTADLISSKVATKDFSAYQDETAKSIDSMVKSKDFESYKTQTAGMIDSKVSNSNYTSDMKQMAGQIEDKVSNGTFSSYKTETANLIGSRVANSDFTTYKTQTADLISAKVATKDFSSYKDETAKAISSKVESNDFNTYKEQTAGMISSKVSNGDFSTYKTQTANDINLRVEKKGLIAEINMQAGNTLISTSGQLTLSGKNILLDSDDPVIMKSANIDRLLVDKQLKAADIEANTFSTNNGTFTVKQDGSVTAKNMTLIGGTLTSPTINASTINSSTINGTTFNAGDIISSAYNTSQFYPTTITPAGLVATTGFNSMDGLRTEMSAGSFVTKYRAVHSSGNQYEAYDGVFSGDELALNSGFTNGIDMGFQQSVSGSQLTGQVVLSPLNGIHLWGSTQSIHFSGLQMNGTGITFNSYGNIIADQASTWWRVTNFAGNDIANFGTDTSGNNPIQFKRELDIGNFNINTGHTFVSADGGAIHFAKGRGGANDIYAGDVHYNSLVKSSLLSVKRDVQKADTAYWAQLVNAIDLATYQYKTDDNTSHIRLSSIVDDVNDTKQWQLPDVFISRDEKGKLCGVDDSVLLNATLATVQEQQKEIDQLNGHNMELEARLNKLEAKLNG